VYEKVERKVKREAIVSSVLALLLLVSVFPMSAYSGAADSHGSSGLVGSQSNVDWWPMFHHDATRIGYSTSTAPNTNQMLWNFTTGDAVESSPAVADGIVFVGSDDGKAYALNVSTGAPIWNYTTGVAVKSSPAVAGGTVYVGSDSAVYALNETTGGKIWNYTTGDAVESSPAVADGIVFVGSDDGKVYALNVSTGASIWNYTTGVAVKSSPAVAGGVVFVGSGYTVYALNETTGRKIWNYVTGDFVFSSPAVAGGKVYVGSDKVYALNASIGTLIWNTTGGAWGSPTVAGGVVYVGSDKVYALNASSGAFVWNYTTGSFVQSSPAVADGKIFVGSWDGKVYALNASTGALVWRYTTGSPVASSPAVADGIVFVGSDDDNVYAFAPIDVTITAHCVTEGADVNVQIAMDGSPTGYTTPHTFTGLTAPHTFTVPDTDPTGHPLNQWNTGETTTNITVSSGGTYTAYYASYDVTINAHSNTEGADVTVSLAMDGSPTGYDTPHTFTNLTGTHTFEVQSTDPSGHPFVQWSTGETTSTLTVRFAGTYTAYYEAKYTLNITTTTGGTTNPFPGVYDYGGGAIAAVTANPNTGYVLDHWELDGANTGTLNPTTVTMNSNHNLYAAFVPVYNITIKAHDINEGADVSVAILLDGMVKGYTTPHTFTGLTGTHTLYVLDTDLNGHAFRQWNTGQTSTMVTVNSGGTYTAYYGQSPVHDVTVTDVTSSKTAVGQNYSLNVNVTVGNPGDYPETFNVTLYANTTVIGYAVTNLPNGAFTVIFFAWDTTGYPYSNYTISAFAWPVSNETDMTDNTFIVNQTCVTIPGDLNGDFKVGLEDLVILAQAYGSKPSDAKWNPNADIDDTGVIGLTDLVVLATHYGQHYP
jgi:outer membrane protein assembly factor BamB